MTSAQSSSNSVSFTTTLKGIGNNTGIVVPPELIEQLGSTKRPAVTVDLNGHVYPSTVGVMGGESLVPVSAAIRKVTGLNAGDPIKVTLTLNTAPRTIDVPEDFAAALDSIPSTRTFFESLSNSLQRFHVDNIGAAKTEETRERRIDKSIDLFRQGKQR
jgi:Bacteriocin-protection, YdeI or OmpD-Associated/Domain of unknown function (DUF1905)